MDLPKLSHLCNVFHKYARKSDDLSILKNNIGNYIHFSNSERFGISYHKDIHPGNPRGVYGFLLTPAKYKIIEETESIFSENQLDVFHDYGHYKYIYIFTVNGSVLNIDNINLIEETEKVKEFLHENSKSTYHTLYTPGKHPYNPDGAQFLQWLGEIGRELFKNTHSAVNILLRGIGYDAVETKRGGFGDHIDSQIVVLQPQSVNLISKVNNPMINREDIEEIDKSIKEREIKELARLEKERKDQIMLQKYREYSVEEEQLYQIERQLWKDKKFDEAKELRNNFKAKWKDLFKSTTII